MEIIDWDDAYANSIHIPDGARWPEAWIEPARRWREAAGERALTDIRYGDAPRNSYDLFLPECPPRGLVVFVHGGYWLALDKSYWSHLARGPVAQGFAVAIPSYTLCPDIRIADIGIEIAAAIEAAAARVSGPIHLVGHSAGGHLVARMIAAPSPLGPATRERIERTISISGLHDLRPLMLTRMNATLRIDDAEAASESPALLPPMHGARLTCWVGANERPEFIRQSELLAGVWKAGGADTAIVHEPETHHFNVIDGLQNPGHPLCKALLAPAFSTDAAVRESPE